MEQSTGRIEQVEKLTPKELKSGKWFEIPKEQVEHFEGLNRKERRKRAKELGYFKKENRIKP